MHFIFSRVHDDRIHLFHAQIGLRTHSTQYPERRTAVGRIRSSLSAIRRDKGRPAIEGISEEIDARGLVDAAVR